MIVGVGRPEVTRDVPNLTGQATKLCPNKSELSRGLGVTERTFYEELGKSACYHFFAMFRIVD